MAHKLKRKVTGLNSTKGSKSITIKWGKNNGRMPLEVNTSVNKVKKTLRQTMWGD